ncbi:unnamed protein product [Phytomonas sp. EM1]|nr:unnamed protein product [Phytomonas sp. EM1]|eukprot:CCW63239.1 unnamed protein product [Phytomonas sp. isolate EM1]
MFLRNARLIYNSGTPARCDGGSNNYETGGSPRRRHDRCSTSPPVVESNTLDGKSGTSSGLALVEERLMIIKRSRASSRSSANSSASPAVRAEVPPCEAYPTFNLSKPSRQDQQTLEALAAECMNALFFPKS